MMRILFIFILLLPAFAHSQNLSDYFEELRKEGTAQKPKVRDLNDKALKSRIKELKPYTNDSLREVRKEAYALLNDIGRATDDSSIIKNAVNKFVQGLKDEDPGIKNMVASRLKYYPRNAISSEAREVISEVVPKRGPAFPELVMVAGYLKMHSLKPALIDMLRNEIKEMSVSEKWNAHLALARMGERRALDFCIKKVKKFPVNDDLIYELVPDLAYTRQKEAFQYLEELIFRDKKECSVADPAADGKMTCAYRVLETVTPYIQDFPLTLGAGGDLDTNDYKAALTQAREWFQENPDYSLKEDVY